MSTLRQTGSKAQRGWLDRFRLVKFETFAAMAYGQYGQGKQGGFQFDQETGRISKDGLPVGFLPEGLVVMDIDFGAPYTRGRWIADQELANRIERLRQRHEAVCRSLNDIFIETHTGEDPRFVG